MKYKTYGNYKVTNSLIFLLKRLSIDLKIPKFPKPNEINQKKPLSPLKEENPLSNEKKENSNPSKHEETYHKPNVRLLNNLEATVDLNREDISAYHSAGKFSTPSFTSSNPSISLDLEGFKLHSDEILNEGLLEENKEFHLSSNVATNLSFLKSVNQMTLESKEIKRGFDLKKNNICRNIEISDYVLMKKGYLDNSYYIYRITSKFEEKNSTKLVERRYSDFEWLHTYLTNHPKYQGLLIPKMPEKHGIGKSFYNYLSSDAEFIKKRKNVRIFSSFIF